MGQGNSTNARDRCFSKTHNNSSNSQQIILEPFHDLKEFPPEIALSILSNLNATDLCLASCVWQELAEDEVLWRG